MPLMDLKKTTLKIGEYLGKTFYYGVCICIGMGFIWIFFVAPAVMMSSRFGWGWGVAWMLVIPLLVYLGRDIVKPTGWG